MITAVLHKVNWLNYSAGLLLFILLLDVYPCQVRGARIVGAEKSPSERWCEAAVTLL